MRTIRIHFAIDRMFQIDFSASLTCARLGRNDKEAFTRLINDGNRKAEFISAVKRFHDQSNLAASRAAARLERLDFFSRQSILALGNGQGLDHLVDVAHYETIQRIQRKAYAVVGYAPLRKVVGADALRTVAAADEALATGVVFGLVAAVVVIVQPRAQNFEGFVLIFELTALVLAGDDNARGEVGYSYGRFGLVYLLAARARRAVNVNPYVLVANLHFDVLGLGKHGDGGRGGVYAALGLRFGHALNAVNAAFELELFVGTLARNI